MIKNNLTVLIGTCDKYDPLWENFQTCFNRTWKVNTENIFVGETIEVPQYTEMKFKTILSQKNTWGARMVEAIQSCKTDYIFFILEDYFFYHSYSVDEIDNYINDMNDCGMNRLQISYSDFQKYIDYGSKKYYKFAKDSFYQISMQPSIWRKEYLLKVLLPDYSPWDFEIKGSEKCIQDLYDHRIYVDKNMPHVYFNAVRNGFKKSQGWEDFMKKYNLKDFKE